MRPQRNEDDCAGLGPVRANAFCDYQLGFRVKYITEHGIFHIGRCSLREQYVWFAERTTTQILELTPTPAVRSRTAIRRR